MNLNELLKTGFRDYGFNIPWFTKGIQEVKPFANSQNLRARLVKKFKFATVNRDGFIRAGYVYFIPDCGYFTVDGQGEKIQLDELTAKELAIDVAIAHSDELQRIQDERAKNVVPYPIPR